MLREKKRKIVAIVCRDDKKNEKQQPQYKNGAATSPAKVSRFQQLNSQDEAKQHRNESSKWNAVFRISEKNQLHPESIFQNDRRNSFSNFTRHSWRTSYDRYQLNTETVEVPVAERRASYDLSYLKTAGLDANLRLHDVAKTTRRGSLVTRWFKRISEAADAHKKDGKQKTSALSVHDLDHCPNGPESPVKTKENDNSHGSSENTSSAADGHANESTAKKPSSGGVVGATSPGLRRKQTPATDPPRLTTEVPLIEPSQVLVSQQAVLTAEPVLTPLEKVRRNYETINGLLFENHKLVSNMLHTQKEDVDGAVLVDASSARAAHDRDATDLVRAALSEVDQFTSLLNECLRVTEEDVITASCEVNVGATKSGGSSSAATKTAANSPRSFPSVPASKLLPITQALRTHHTVLLTMWKEREEERERQRIELQKSREQLHAMHELQQRIQRIGDQTTTTTMTTQNESSQNFNKDIFGEEVNKANP